MAIRDIRLFGDPILRTAADPVADFDKQLRSLVKDLTQTLDDAQGAGLAAPQIGVGLRVFAYAVGSERGYLVNPVLEFPDEEEQYGEEGCLSFPGIYYDVKTAFMDLQATGEQLQVATRAREVAQTALDQSRAELERREGIAGARDVGAGDPRELHARRAREALHGPARFFLGTRGDDGRRHGDDAHFVAIALARREVVLLGGRRQPDVDAEAHGGEKQQEEQESRHVSGFARDQREAVEHQVFTKVHGQRERRGDLRGGAP